MSELWIKLYAVNPWMDSAVWDLFFARIESVLGDKVTKLDDKDPPRRLLTTKDERQKGEFVVSFPPSSVTRWVFGKFKKNKIDIAIHHHLSPRHGVADHPNSMSIYISGLKSGIELSERVLSIFKVAVDLLQPFYAFADIKDYVVLKKRQSGAVNLQQELIGFFWLTYFNDKYADYLSIALKCPNVEKWRCGVFVRIAEDPCSAAADLRQALEDCIGREYFVDPLDNGFKPAGRHALLFSELMNK